MDAISLSTIRARVDACNELFKGRNFVLAHGTLDTHQLYMVDLRYRATENMLSSYVVNFLTRGLPDWDFQLYFVGDVAADTYDVTPGLYLAICFLLP